VVRHAAVLADGVDRHDAGMLQARDRLGLAPEAFARAREVELLGPDQFERDVAAQALLARAEHDAHAADAEAFEQTEIAQALGKTRVVARVRGTHETERAQSLDARADVARERRVGAALELDAALEFGAVALQTTRD